MLVEYLSDIYQYFILECQLVLYQTFNSLLLILQQKSSLLYISQWSYHTCRVFVRHIPVFYSLRMSVISALNISAEVLHLVYTGGSKSKPSGFQSTHEHRFRFLTFFFSKFLFRVKLCHTSEPFSASASDPRSTGSNGFCFVACCSFYLLCRS